MAAPIPLTQCDPPQLDWSREGTPAASDFGDIYFSTDGGIAETEQVFLQGCGLPQAWQNRRCFVIGETGFGSGLNFLTTWQMWERTKPKDGRLHFVSVEKHPFDAAQLERALSHWPQLADKALQLIADWPGRVKGFHRLHFGDVTLTLIHDDIALALSELDAQIDAWFLDGFSPTKNPEMWAPEIMGMIAGLCAPGARLASFTVAGTVRQALSSAGFEVERKDGFGRKRHRLEARFPGKPTPEIDITPPTIIGAGIAGSSLARAFSRRNIVPTIFHIPTFQAASHNPAAIIKPRLDLQDRPESRFFLSSYLYANAQYPGHILHTSVRQIAKSDAEDVRFTKLAAQAPLPKNHLCLDPPSGNLLFPRASIIDPHSVIADWIKGAEIIEKEFSSTGDNLRPLILAGGYGLKSILESGDIDAGLRYSRGQLSWAKKTEAITETLSYGGYAIPLDRGLLLGATHQRVSSDPHQLNSDDDAENFQNLLSHTAIDARRSDLPSRASVRVTTADTLPMINEFSPGQWIFTGLGSRGFVFAPLLAEAIVSKLCGEPLPISTTVWARFQAREKPNLKARPS